MKSELPFLPVARLASLLDRKEISPVEIVTALLERIDRYSARLRSYITVCADSALEAARRAEKEIVAGRRWGPLHGIPVSHKDISWTKGVLTTAHSRAMLDHVPEHDAAHVRRLAEAGMILLGKTNTTEFACGAMEVFGTALNPWDETRYTGGSSCGSANALAAALAVAATGSDTGGSIRVPSSFCGIVGLKPTFGRVSRYGVIALSWSQDHAGPMTRTVADNALMLNVMAGRDPLDPTTADLPVPDFTSQLNAGVKGLVLGIPRQYFYEGLDPDVDAAIRATHKQFESLGARLEPVDLPHAGELGPVGNLLVMAEAYAVHAARLRARAAEYGDRPRRRISAGAFYTSAEYSQALQLRALWIREVDAALEKVDAIITPTTCIPAFPVAVQEAGPPDTSWGTRHFNLSGHPALSIPCGFTAGGLPVGMQIVAKAFDEVTMYRVAHAYEQSTPWHARRLLLDEPRPAAAAAGAPKAASPAGAGAGHVAASGPARPGAPSTRPDDWVSMDWLRTEAKRQGLPLTDEDLEVIRAQVADVKAGLAARRPKETEGLEPPYTYLPPIHGRHA